MEISVKKENGTTEVALDGRLDSSTAEKLNAVLTKELDSVERELVIEMKNVDFISSIGLRVFVSAYKKLNGKPFIIKNPNSSVQEVLKLSGLLKVFQVVPNRF